MKKQLLSLTIFVMILFIVILKLTYSQNNSWFTTDTWGNICHWESGQPYPETFARTNNWFSPNLPQNRQYLGQDRNRPGGCSLKLHRYDIYEVLWTPYTTVMPTGPLPGWYSGFNGIGGLSKAYDISFYARSNFSQNIILYLSVDGISTIPIDNYDEADLFVNISFHITGTVPAAFDVPDPTKWNLFTYRLVPPSGTVMSNLRIGFLLSDIPYYIDDIKVNMPAQAEHTPFLTPTPNPGQTQPCTNTVQSVYSFDTNNFSPWTNAGINSWYWYTNGTNGRMRSDLFGNSPDTSIFRLDVIDLKNGLLTSSDLFIPELIIKMNVTNFQGGSNNLSINLIDQLGQIYTLNSTTGTGYKVFDFSNFITSTSPLSFIDIEKKSFSYNSNMDIDNIQFNWSCLIQSTATPTPTSPLPTPDIQGTPPNTLVPTWTPTPQGTPPLPGGNPGATPTPAPVPPTNTPTRVAGTPAPAPSSSPPGPTTTATVPGGGSGTPPPGTNPTPGGGGGGGTVPVIGGGSGYYNYTEYIFWYDLQPSNLNEKCYVINPIPSFYIPLVRISRGAISPGLKLCVTYVNISLIVFGLVVNVDVIILLIMIIVTFKLVF